MSEPKLKLSADVGGTFTDVVLEHGAQRWTGKVLTTPASPEEGVLRGVGEILTRAGRSIADVDIFVHGTTLATNAIIERRGAKLALLTTDGFRDVLEIGTESRYDQYELALIRPKPLVERPLRFTIRERVDARGKIRLALNEADVRAVAEQLAAHGIESVAIAFLHSYANPTHEKAAAELLRSVIPGLYVTLSSEVCPEIREYERVSTSVTNAYVQPLMDSYLARMKSKLDTMGFRGALCLMTSGGGLTSVDTARKFPVRLVESGPAGGAVFAAQVAARLGERKVLAFDMGGTTAKVSIIDEYRSETSRVFEVDRAARFLKGSGLPVRIPVIEMVEIGAGGGSLARLDNLKRVTVGPESASSVPGPVCYNIGGSNPAVTDADVALGLIDPATFAGGTIKLYPDLAKTALQSAIGEPLGLDAEMAAYAVYEMVCENMASAARVHTVERGVVASNHTVIAFGGAAPLHVARVAEKIGAQRVIVPPNAGVGSAVGFLAAPISYEMVKTKYMRLESFDAAAATELLAAMSRDIRAWVEPAAQGEPVAERRVAFMRYVGQGHEIAVELPLRDLDATDTVALRARYEADYEKLFRRAIPAAAIEIMAWSVNVSTISRLPEQVKDVSQFSSAQAGESIRIFDGKAGKPIDVSRYRRDKLPVGARLAGPAIIAEEETSTFITESFDAWIDSLGSIVMERKGMNA
ncbi:hydantoinase/oxoprolinase family protein [Bradyrhizobium sp.]|jgi:N-methylhydantoinase A|uniref:hydantoinase/oxoprolinase family protein n=1 Tax=Bradyrhizobium sp. TaxID=376 RepID=UPI002DDC9021|nr:hydantoinase/oxoprolinase family protein [Bradyrhizobium sp.]HEV2157867.1 hydantoinase/oxoprolinase family protein [Bradyrhizobium sp.]